ncbi:MAG: bifunctional phosphopantothenoylcysteine decarboxylase/phosphopantothenate--cysteine ligase CoaBC, partial [Raoultibacter sp.]
MITAGPTVEAIDPVRYISNHSSGKTGYALARAAAHRGADVTLISGPTALSAPGGVHFIPVKSACEMYEAAEEAFAQCDIALFSAAVSDMRPKSPADRKLKKGQADAELGTIELVENPDILATLGNKKTHQVVVGFAAETDHVIENAEKKLKSKNADMIVANEVGNGLGFGTEDNKVWLVSEDDLIDVPKIAKSKLADVILDRAADFL